jgi:Eisosome protein 1
MAQTTAPAVATTPIQNANQPTRTSNKLEDQAAIAALYVTKYDNASKTGREFLDSDNKLSSAGESSSPECADTCIPPLTTYTGAAASLRYAQAQDLPSFPSTGLRNGDSAAGAAASLGWANHKSFELWKPDPSASAFAAAVLAKDYKMPPLWQPEHSTNGAKAALLAHRDGGKVEIWKPEASTWGNSAANQAFKKDRAGELSPQLDYGHTALGRQGSLLAATGAMLTSRKRAESTPLPSSFIERYPDEANATANALSAATSASRNKKRANIMSDGGAVPFTTMSREMYTSHPPVAPEVDEQNRQATLHASAIAMAKQIYNHQQKQIDAASAAHSGAMAAHHRRPSSPESADDAQPMRFNNLQEAAQKLAHERLAKLHDDHAKNREYRDYYGNTPKTPSRLSIRGRTRRRASSDGSMDEDREQSHKIRAQMSLFSSNLSQVDAKKRQQDREALIATAQRNVTKSLHGMDEKVFADTGKVAPSLLSEWEVKAHAAAQIKSNTRMENYGKVNIGGGKFISQRAVDLVAQRNVQPVLDEINEKAEAERERVAAAKSEQETQVRKAAELKAREKEKKEIDRKLKRRSYPKLETLNTNLDKEQSKDEQKLVAAEGKAARREEKQAAKEKRKSLKTGDAATAETATGPEATAEVTTADEAPATIAERRTVASTPVPIRTSMENQASKRMQETADAANKGESTTLALSSPGDGSKVKNWLKTKFSRRMSKPQKPSATENEKEPEKAFVGGAALTGASANNSKVSLVAKPSSVEDVAMAGKTKEPETELGLEERGRGKSRDSEVSASSEPFGDVDEEEFQEARDNFDEDLAPPPTFVAEKSSSPARSAKFREEI